MFPRGFRFFSRAARGEQPADQPADQPATDTPPVLQLNWLSLGGTFLAILGLFIAIFTFLLDLLSGESQAYTGLLYMLYLGLMMFGLSLVPVGMFLERRRRSTGAGPSLPSGLVINFHNASHRATLFTVLAIASLILLVVVVGSNKVYQATETNAFCGQVCHTVMEPEFTAYQYSSHARVHCVECHIGTGSEWYVKSKISGIRQIFAVLGNTFPRPIPTPIHDLRPARETCEQCHWPKKFIGYKDVVRNYYMSDEENTPHRIRMLMKIGGEEHALMRGSGIHYHMLLSGKVEYIARDQKRQDIAWVRITHNDRTSETFEDSDNPLSEEDKKGLEVRTMDCMDCHNRPSHQLPTPMRLVNQAMEVGDISRALPKIKEQSVRALSETYANEIAAMEGIQKYLLNFYGEEYPALRESLAVQLLGSVEAVQTIYKRSVFPEMNASWKSYPDNIGHRDFPGCFRCHNDRLQNEASETIFTTCNKCHLILAQGESVDRVESDLIEGLSFVHPGEDGEDISEYTECTECHTGGPDVYD